MKIVAISGSTRRRSHNTSLLRAAAELAPYGIEVVVWEGLKGIPHYDQEEEAISVPAVEEFRATVADADAVLFATPEYNSSIPGSLKNALDWASRPSATGAFRNKHVAVMSSSAGMFGGVWAAAELRKVLSAMGARVADVELSVGKTQDKVDEEGTLVDDEAREQVRDAVATLVAAVEALQPTLAAA